MTMSFREFGLGALAICMAACSGSSGANNTPQPFSTFCPAVLQARATYLNKCQGGPVSVWEALDNPTTTCAEVQAAITAGRMTYTATGAQPCLSAIAAIPCSAEAPDFSACASALTGTVATGGSCNSSYDCKTAGNYCSVAPGTCGGTCAAPIAAGATCTAGQVCAAGYTCTGTCTAVPVGATLGQPCGYNIDAGVNVACANLLACDLTTGTCANILRQGNGCPVGHGICENYTYCNPNNGQCTVYPSDAGSFCGIAGTEDYVGCLPPTYCSPGPMGFGSCTPQFDAGAPCTASNQCLGYPGAFCTGSIADAGACVPACTQK